MELTKIAQCIIMPFKEAILMNTFSLLAYLFLIVLFCQNGFAAASKTIQIENAGTVEYQIKESTSGYDSLNFSISWKLQNQDNIHRSSFFFLAGRALPKNLKYITIQNQKDELVLLTKNEADLLNSAARELAADIPYHQEITDFISILINTPNITAEYFERTNESNIYTNDGLVWAAGWYTKKNSLQYVVAPVGDEKTQCFGRQGSKCGKPQFSRESLNHDICHRMENEQLGECLDEFWSAAVSRTSSDLLKTLF